MAKQLAVKGIPDELFEWLYAEKDRRALSLKEVTEQIIEEARSRRSVPSTDDEASSDVSLKHSKQSAQFRFIDLFAGIGGFRIGMESLGGQCCFIAEWDKYSQKTYVAWAVPYKHLTPPTKRTGKSSIVSGALNKIKT